MQITYIPNPLIEVQAVLMPEVHLVVNTYGAEVARRASDLAPVLTGALAASLRVEPSGLGSPAEAAVIADRPYSGYVEWGTAKMAARPYLRPALDGVIPGRSE